MERHNKVLQIFSYANWYFLASVLVINKSRGDFFRHPEVDTETNKKQREKELKNQFSFVLTKIKLEKENWQLKLYVEKQQEGKIEKKGKINFDERAEWKKSMKKYFYTSPESSET